MTMRSEQLLILAESFLKRELPCEKLREYQRLKRKLETETPKKNIISNVALTSSKKTQSRSRLQSNTQRKTIKSNTKRTLQITSQPETKNFIQNIIYDLNSIRQKILRKECSRKSIKQLELRTKQSSDLNNTLFGEVRLSLQRIILALDIQTLKVREQLSRHRNGGDQQLGKAHKDNKWLIEQIQSLVQENQKLKAYGAGFIKHRK